MKRANSKHKKAIQKRSAIKESHHLKSSNFAHKIQHYLKTTLIFIRHNKRIILVIILPIVILALILLSQSWLVQSTFWQAKTYPSTSVFGTNVGNLDAGNLDDALVQVKSRFESQKITLVNGEDKWTYDYSELGSTFDVQATIKTIMNLNGLSFGDKMKLITGGINSTIEPTINVNNETCLGSLSKISIAEVAPSSASLYFDKEVKLNPDQIGTKFNATLTCQEIGRELAKDQSTINIQFDTTLADITKADLEPKISTAQFLVGSPLSLENGSYKLSLTSEQLFDLLEVSKNDSGVQIGWSSNKLDVIINGMADSINTYDNGPALGNCQYLVSAGGNWLDKTATKKIFTDLSADSPRSYNLSVIYNSPVTHSITPVTPGSSGTVYLTFDDGMTYANQIMNYAACYGIKVTFFELGSRVGTDATALRRAIAEGHAVQSHGTEHAVYDYGTRSYDWQYNDIAQSIGAIISVTGVRPTYFRPPGGNRSSTTYDAAAANGVNLILWGISSADTAGYGSSFACNNVLAGVFPGASVLMHSTKQSTANAVPCIVEGLAAKGYNMQALR